MSRIPTPSFVVTLPLETLPSDERRLTGVFEAGKRLTNVTVQHGRAVVAAVRADLRWALARTLPQKTVAERKARGAAFTTVQAAHGFTETAFESVAIRHKNAAGFADRLGAHVTQKIARKVFAAFEQHLYGKHGAPRFKGFKRPLKSLEGKNNQTMLRWDADARFLVMSPKWGFSAKVPDLDKDEWLWTALQAPTKYCCIVWRMVDGHRRYFVQLVQEGEAPMKASVLDRLAPVDTVGGLDIGPSTLAWCTATDAGLMRFCDEVEAPDAQARRLQRRTDRQRRANNPNKFDEAGRIKRTAAPWVLSERQRVTQVRHATALADTAAARANAHGRDINDLMALARTWRHDGVSVKSLQKNYGRSIGKRAPGHFMDELERKAARAGGKSIAQSSRVLKTSQYCHVRNDCKKKSLSERWHLFPDGFEVQRDVYSAFLARNAVERVDADGVIGWAHDPVVLAAAFETLRPRLVEQRLYRKALVQDESGRGCIPRGARSHQSRSCKVPALPGPGGTARGATRVETFQRPAV